MDMVTDPSLILYLPLYELDGNSLMSRDKYGHLCTVTGALWTPQGRSFDGVNDVISLSHSVFAFTSTFTIEAWVKLDASPPAQHHPLICIGESGERWDLWARRNAVGNYVTLFSSVGGAYASTLHSLTPEVWSHIVAVCKASDTIDFYIDGLSAGTPAFTAFPAWGGTVKVGGRGGSEFLKGNIGEVRIYGRGLTFQEVRQNFLATKWRYR